jgi:hypothetical protein
LYTSIVVTVVLQTQVVRPCTWHDVLVQFDDTVGNEPVSLQSTWKYIPESGVMHPFINLVSGATSCTIAILPFSLICAFMEHGEFVHVKYIPALGLCLLYVYMQNK